MKCTGAVSCCLNKSGPDIESCNTIEGIYCVKGLSRCASTLDVGDCFLSALLGSLFVTYFPVMLWFSVGLVLVVSLCKINNSMPS